MEMKDKLVKHGHFRNYYKLRSFLSRFLFGFVVISSLAFPTYIVINSNRNSTTHAESSESTIQTPLDVTDTIPLVPSVSKK